MKKLRPEKVRKAIQKNKIESVMKKALERARERLNEMPASAPEDIAPENDDVGQD